MSLLIQENLALYAKPPTVTAPKDPAHFLFQVYDHNSTVTASAKGSRCLASKTTAIALACLLILNVMMPYYSSRADLIGGQIRKPSGSVWQM